VLQRLRPLKEKFPAIPDSPPGAVDL